MMRCVKSIHIILPAGFLRCGILLDRDTGIDWQSMERPSTSVIMYQKLLAVFGAVFFSFTLLVSPANACQVCIPVPQSTVADKIIAADAVVLARSNPQDPFSYRAVKILKGTLTEPEIDLFVDYSSRRWLAGSPDRAVLLVRKNSGESDQEWKALGFATPEFEKVVQEILARSPQWRGGADAAMRRATFFMPYLASKERKIHDLAYLEVGQAPYDLLRRADRFVSPKQIKTFLSNLQYLEWQNLYILLLGVEASEAEAEHIRRKMKTLTETGNSLHLAAWSTALIEVDGSTGIDMLEREFLAQGTVDRERVIEVMKALSVQGSLDQSPHRARIVEAYDVALQGHPELAGRIARDLAAWQDWSLMDALSHLRADGPELDNASLFALDYYLGVASAACRNSATC